MINFNGETYFNANETANILNISQSTLRRWRLKKLIKYIKISQRKILYSKKHIETYLNGI